MKIAIQFFGHTRTFADTYKYLIKNVIKPNKRFCEFDIFIHTWDESDSTNFGVYKKSKKFMGKKLSYKQKEQIKDFYSPKGLEITEQLPLTQEDRAFIEKEKISENLMKTLKNVSFSIQETAKLRQEYQKKTGIKYDYIITTRMDILFMKELSLRDLNANKLRGEWFDKEKKVILYPSSPYNEKLYYTYILCDSYGQIMDNEFYICGVDLFHICTPKLADKIAEFHTRLYEMKGLYPEHVMSKIALENHVKNYCIGYEKDKCWTILRNNYYFMKSPYLRPFRKLGDAIFGILLYPLLIISIRFRQMVLLNPHWLERKFKGQLKQFLK